MDTAVQEDLRNAAAKYGEVEHRTNMFLGDILNEYGYNKLKKSIEDTREVLEPVNSESNFEDLIKRDMEYNLKATDEYADFIRKDSSLGVEEMFDLVYGEGSFERLRRESKKFDERAQYETNELLDRIIGESSWTIENEIKEMIYDISGMVEEWSKERGYMPEDFDFETSPIPQGVNQRAGWQGEINKMNIPIEYFDVIRGLDGEGFGKGEYKVDATRTIFAIFHELVGHGVHQYNSKNLDYPNFAENPRYRPASLGHCEGVSQHREELARDFIFEKRDELPVLDIGMKLRDAQDENQDRRLLYSRFVAEMESRDEISEEEAEAKVGEIYSPEVADRVLNHARNKTSLLDAFGESSYIAGLKLMEDVDADNQSTKALTTGQWTPEVFPDAVEYFSRAN